MVKYITYQKKKYPVRISYYALKRVKSEHGVSIENIQDTDYEIYESLLFYSLEKGHKMTNKPLELKREEMEDVLDEVFFEFIGLIPQFFPPRGTETATDNPEIEKGEIAEKK